MVKTTQAPSIVHTDDRLAMRHWLAGLDEHYGAAETAAIRDALEIAAERLEGCRSAGGDSCLRERLSIAQTVVGLKLDHYSIRRDHTAGCAGAIGRQP